MVISLVSTKTGRLVSPDVGDARFGGEQIGELTFSGPKAARYNVIFFNGDDEKLRNSFQAGNCIHPSTIFLLI